MSNSDINALIAFLLLLIPFGFLWYKIFKHFKNRLTTTLSKWVLTLISLICLITYYYLMGCLGFVIDGRIGDSIAMASFAAYVFAVVPLIIVFIGTLILTIAYYLKKRQTLN
jgi:hypothetical protein